MKCEHCDQQIESVEVAHSMVIVLQKVSTDGYSYYQCDQGTEYGGLTYQHFCCSHPEMVSMVQSCINTHYHESDLIAISPQQVRLHRTVLNAHLTCKVCQLALTTQAYRLCLTYATPDIATPLGDSLNELSGWCCSLSHAQESALAIIGSLAP